MNLAKELTNMLRSWGFKKLKVRHNAEDDFFYCDTKKKVIYYGFADPDEDYISYIRKNYDIDISDRVEYFIFSFLHELGHHETDKTLTKSEKELDNTYRTLLQLLMEEDNETYLNNIQEVGISLDDIYFALPSEVAANDYAANLFVLQYLTFGEDIKNLYLKYQQE